MSDGGGDGGGGGDKGGGGDYGGFGSPGSNYSGPAVDYSAYTPSSSSSSSFAPTDTSSGPSSLPDTSGGGSGGLPSEITTGSSGGGSSAPSISDLLSGSGGDGGFNLSGPGPVGGGIGAPTAGGDVFSTDSGGGGGTSLSQDTNALGTTAPSAGGGTSALAFAAPSGVSGTPQLDSLVTDPSGGAGSSAPISPSDQGIFDSLNGAQAGAVNDYATKATGIDSSGQTTLPATSSSTPTTLASIVDPSSAVPPSGGTSLDSKGNAGNGISTNSLGVAAAGAGLLNNLVNGNKAVPQSPALNAVAGSSFNTSQQQVASGTALEQYVATGKLPQGYEDQVQQSAQAAKSQIISNYANRGQETDPTKNSALAQELAQVDSRLPAAREQLASELAKTGGGMVTTGLQAAGISSDVFKTLANLENSQNTARGQAIANFASSLNGGGNKGVTVNLGKAA